jgi:hypothetical protein
MDRDDRYGVWDPSAALTGTASPSNSASDPFAPMPPADPWASPADPAPPTASWPSPEQHPPAPPWAGAPPSAAEDSWPSAASPPSAPSWVAASPPAAEDSWPAGSEAAGSGEAAQPTVAWGDEAPTVVWPWGAEQSQVSWGTPPAPGAMDFPAAEPLPARPSAGQPTAADPLGGDLPWGPAVAPVQPVPSRPAPGSRRLAIVAGAVLAVLLGAGGVGLALRGGDDDPAPGSTTAEPRAGGQKGGQNGGQAGNDQPTFTPATPSPATSSAAGPSPATSSPAPDRQAAAVAQLEQIYDQDRGSVSFDGQYVAQIASKYPGITDKLQTTADGSHRFEASDILAEYRELSSGHNSSEHPVVLLKSTDYGKHQIKNGHFLWVTFALGEFPSPQSVTVWCNAEFSDLSTAERANQCVPRQLEP